jgi:hypothetical protein
MGAAAYSIKAGSDLIKKQRFQLIDESWSFHGFQYLAIILDWRIRLEKRGHTLNIVLILSIQDPLCEEPQ